MLQIGVFSRISQVSVKALRHYDEIGVFVLALVDEWSGYRYYTLEQLPRLNRLLALKDLGFPLDQIAAMLKQPGETGRIREMLAQK